MKTEPVESTLFAGGAPQGATPKCEAREGN